MGKVGKDLSNQNSIAVESIKAKRLILSPYFMHLISIYGDRLLAAWAAITLLRAKYLIPASPFMASKEKLSSRTSLAIHVFLHQRGKHNVRHRVARTASGPQSK